MLKFSNPWVLQQKTIFAFLVNWFQFNYRLVVAFTTNDWQLFNGFVYLKNFVQFLRGINFFRLWVWRFAPFSWWESLMLLTQQNVFLSLGDQGYEWRDLSTWFAGEWVCLSIPSSSWLPWNIQKGKNYKCRATAAMEE